MLVRDMYLTGRNVPLKSNGKGRLEELSLMQKVVHLHGVSRITCVFSA
jgi:hypothetical protein